jgi:salicylate hydroxylase
MTRLSALVVGAGLGGLTAALALLQRGVRVTVVERSSVLGEVGAGVMVTPSFTRILAALGLAADLERIGSEPVETIYRRFDTGEVVTRASLKGMMLEQYGARSFNVHRADLHAALVQHVASKDPKSIRLGHQLVAFDEGPSGIEAHFVNGATLKADVLVGSDGVHSQVRAQLFGGGDATFRKQVAWRGLVPSGRAPESLRGDANGVWVGEGRHIIHYPLRNKSVINYVAVVSSEHWTGDGWNCPGEIAELLTSFEGWHADAVNLLAATDPAHCIKWGLFGRPPLDSWVKGRVALLGDAAHPMLPFMAQGAAMAVEDGYILARALTEAPDVEDGLRRFEQARKTRAHWVVEQSTAATPLYQSVQGDKAAGRARNLDHLYSYDATAVAV